MKFYRYLNEAEDKRTVEVGKDKALKDIFNNYNKTLVNFLNGDVSIWKGFGYASNIDEPQSYEEIRFYHSDPKKIERRSVNTTNHYTLLIDNLPEWKKFPKRSRSLICSTDYHRATDFGSVCLVLPKNNGKIGICSSVDFWESFKYFVMNDFNWDLETLLNAVSNVKISDKNWNILKQAMIEFDKKLPTYEKRQDVSHDYFTILSSLNYITNNEYDGNLLKSLSKSLDPDMNGFKLVQTGSALPPYREVWTDALSYLISVGDIPKNRLREYLSIELGKHL